MAILHGNFDIPLIKGHNPFYNDGHLDREAINMFQTSIILP